MDADHPANGGPFARRSTVKAFNGLGKSIANHKKKGDKLIVNGEIRYTRNEKDGRTYYNTEIVADQIEFI